MLFLQESTFHRYINTDSEIREINHCVSTVSILRAVELRINCFGTGCFMRQMTLKNFVRLSF